MELLMNGSELLDLGKGLRGMHIECRAGRCWLTQAGDSRDHILGAGDSFTVRTGGRVIISATGQCRIMLAHGQKRGFQLLPRAEITRIVNNSPAGTTA